MNQYLTRVADAELTQLMKSTGAVLIEGPKACGKTATARQIAATEFDMEADDAARASVDLNTDYLFDRPTPILFDEWQVVPALWNRVRRAVDSAGRERGRYLLTGSATPRDDVNRHSGAGRFGVLRMRPMSLFESEHSNGEVSLRALLDGESQTGRDNGMTIPQLMERIVVGGWPDLLDADEPSARRWLTGYLRQIVEVDIPEFVGRRDPRTLTRILASLGRYVGQSPAITAIGADAGGDRGPVAASTLYSHLDALERLRLLDNSEAWQPHMRSRTRLRSKPTRYFVDPSIGTAALGVTSQNLLDDLNAAGFHFEALCIRDLRVYAQMLGGRVETWRDESGNEVDAIVTLPGGQWAGIEIKLNPRDADRAAAGLLKFAERVDTKKQGDPGALIVLTSAGAAGRRPDGVHVVPITALAP
ncbi:ATP-binding protein [Brevibacterium moorei]|uniref:ATP-binding protein n=1 Tax=Brevibacterium moorei TaxID=2968457 RepID=UPI00211C2783|nr:DUF4143 domain-containing protein [Brevibacterium sp. 68QC2CO]MCQ9385465.1 DUF4143 domain-containing protein [Brevibacterium sp. 68QC2CO]